MQNACCFNIVFFSKEILIKVTEINKRMLIPISLNMIFEHCWDLKVKLIRCYISFADKMRTLLITVFSFYYLLQLYTIEAEGDNPYNNSHRDPTYGLICGQSCVAQPFNGTTDGTLCCNTNARYMRKVQMCCKERDTGDCYSCKLIDD